VNIGELVGYIKLDGSGVGQGIRDAQAQMKSGMDRLTNDAGAAGEKAGKAAGSRLSGAFGSAVKTIGAGLVAGLAVGKVVDYLRGTIDAASDLNETVNMSTVIFGRNQTAIEQWASKADRALGLSTEAAMRNAASFGDMFLQLGFAEDKALAMSTAVVQMSADLGSFKNLKTEDVLQRIAAGFRGEYDSLQLLIPNISAARVEQEALTATGKKSAASLTAQEKATATLAIVQRDGARAAGDYARTADSKANAEKTAAAAAENLAAKIGGALLPAYTALVKFGRDQVIPFLSGTVDALTAAGNVIGPVASGLGAVVGAFRDLPGPLQGAIIGLVAFIALKDRLTTFGGAVRTHVVDAATAAHSTLDTLRLRAMYAGEAANAAGGGFKGMATALGQSASVGLRGAASGLLGVLGGPWGLAFTAAVAAVGGFAQAQANARRAAEDFSRTLDAQTGAVTKATREMALKKLLDDFSAEDWKRVGDESSMSLRKISEGVLTTGADLASFREEFDRVQQAMLMSEDDEVRARWGALGNTVAAATRDLDGARLMTEMTRQGMSGFSDTTETTTDKVSKQTGAVEDLRAAHQRLAGNYASAREAARDYEESVDKLTDAIRDNGTTMDIGTQKGRDNERALYAVADAAVTAAREQLRHGEGVEAAANTIEARRATFIDQAAKLLGSRDAAARLADQLGLTRGKVDELSREIADTPAGKDIKITVDAAEATARINGFKALLGTVQNKRIAIDVATGWTGSAQRHGSIMEFARGGIRAGIYADGADIVRFAERGTMGESYIPHNPGDRRRATAILAETNRRFGDPLGANADVPTAALAAAVREGLSGARLELTGVGVLGDVVSARLVSVVDRRL
jgi:hypothetical protein